MGVLANRGSQVPLSRRMTGRGPVHLETIRELRPGRVRGSEPVERVRAGAQARALFTVGTVRPIGAPPGGDGFAVRPPGPAAVTGTALRERRQCPVQGTCVQPLVGPMACPARARAGPRAVARAACTHRVHWVSVKHVDNINRCMCTVFVHGLDACGSELARTPPTPLRRPFRAVRPSCGSAANVDHIDPASPTGGLFPTHRRPL